MPRARPDPDDFLPLRPLDLHVLVALSERDRHGYGIVQTVAERSDNKIVLAPGNLYPVLRRLVEAGLIRDDGERLAEDLEHKQRRYYAITDLGRRVAAAEALRLRSLLREQPVRALIKEWSGG